MKKSFYKLTSNEPKNKTTLGLILKITAIAALVVIIVIGSTMLYHLWKIGETCTYKIEDFGKYDSFTNDYIEKYGMIVFPKEIPEGTEAKEYRYITSKSMTESPGFYAYLKVKPTSSETADKELERLKESGAVVLEDVQNDLTLFVSPEIFDENKYFTKWYFDGEIVDGMAWLIDAAIVRGDGTIEYLYAERWDGRKSDGNFYADYFAHHIIEAYDMSIPSGAE